MLTATSAELRPQVGNVSDRRDCERNLKPLMDELGSSQIPPYFTRQFDKSLNYKFKV